MGVPIYWLNGAKVADDYADFYDEDWDEEAADKNELGNNGRNTNNSSNYPLTGCDHDGTQAFTGATPVALGSSTAVRVGRPNSSATGHGPISNPSIGATPTSNRPMYGLSAVFEVAAAANSDPTFPMSTADRDVEENTAAGQDVGAVLTATDADMDTLTYTLEGADSASFDLVTVSGSAQIRTKTGVTYDHEVKSSYTVVVKADDNNGGAAATVTVTIEITDEDEPPERPAAPMVTATTGSTTSLDVSWTEPATTGPDIDDYDLRYREGASGPWTNSPQNVTATTTAIGSLDAGTSYQVQVRATNDEGDSRWSPSGTGQTSMPATPTVSISADKTSAVFKEDGITYTLTRSGSTTAALPVMVTLTQTKDFLLATELTKTVTIAAGQSTETFTVAASSFQHFAAGTRVGGGTLTAAVQDGADYDLGSPSSVDVSIVIGVTVRFEQASYTIGEAGGTLSVKLIGRTGAGAPQPTSMTGNIVLSSNNGSAINFTDFDFFATTFAWGTGAFIADGGRWKAEHSLDITITNDALDENSETFNLKVQRHASTLAYSLVDANGNSCGSVCTVTVTITDDDTAGVTISKSSLTVTEQDATGDTYTVVLDSQPTANVTISIGGQSGTDVTAAPTPMTFTSTNWATAQTVTVTGDDDADLGNDMVSLTHNAASSDGDYQGITIDGVTVTVEDNDTAQVTGVMVEPGNAQLVVQWTAVANATGYQVQWKSGGQGYNNNSRRAVIGSGSTTSHTISSLSNGTEYTVRVRATRTGANSGAYSAEVLKTPVMPTAAGVTISKSALTVGEEDSTGDSYTVVLDRLPTSSVTVTVGGLGTSDVTANPGTLTFTTGNWATAQTVTVTAGDDADTTNDTVSLTHSAASGDSDYQGITIAGVTVTVEDNDTTPPECDALWCATLTVGQHPTSIAFTGFSTSYGALTPNEFTRNGSPITVNMLNHDGTYLSLFYTGDLSGSGYTLELGSRSFDFPDPDGDGFFEVQTGRGWSVGDTMEVKLLEATVIASDDATLQSLIVSYSIDEITTNNAPIDPEFSPDTTSYTAGVPSGVTVGILSAVANEAEAELLVTLPDGSTQQDTGDAQDLYGDVSPGLNTFTVKVTAPDGITMKVYTVIVDRGGGLSGRIENLPSSHDGSTAFSVTLKFNTDISDDSIDNLDGAIEIKNGTKSDLAAVGSSKRNFTMTITPSSGDPVRILVQPTRDCSSSGHPICTDAGDALGGEIKRWVGKEDDARLSALWLTTKGGIWLGGTGSDTYSYDGHHSFSELTMQAAPYAKGATVVVTGPAGTFTAGDRWDGGAAAKLNVPEGSTTWRVTVTSADGNETKTYRVTVRRGAGGGGPAADVRLKTLTVTPVNGTLLSFTPSFHLGTEARTFRVRVSSGTTAVTVSVEKNASDPDVRLMRTETVRLDAIDQDPDLAGVQFDLEMDRFDLELGRQNRYRSIWVIGPNARVEGHTAFNRRVYQLWITKAAASMATEAEPLMAAFENPPLSHDGSSAFTLRIAFSEDVEITPEDMRDHALTVLGGTVTGAEQVEGLKTLWDLTLQPSGNGSVFILTPLNRACTEVGALCTADGGTLTVAPALQIAGPPPPQVNNPATGAPTVTGTAQVGETLSADTSGIADADGLANVSFSYQWIRNDGSSDTDITGATDSTYSLDDADEGKTIKVKVGFTDDAGSDESLASAATASVAARPDQGSAPDTPDRPVGTAVFAGGVDLEWNDVPGADSYDVQLFRNGQWMDLPGDGVEIAFYGAGAIISELDPGSTHWVQVRARNAHGSSDWSDYRQVGSTNQSSLGKRARPGNVTASGAPVINGTAQVGESLTADAAGIEDGNGLDRVQFRFQWVTNDGSADADITGATDSTYILVAADEGKTVKVRVSFTDRGGYAESLTSDATDTVSFAVQQQVANSPATGAPAISGTAQVGQTLTADTSGIADTDGLSNVTYSYQWVANDGTNDTDISGATGSTYTLVAADEGNTVKVKVSFTDDADNGETLTSAATAAVDAASNSPATGAPAITGAAQIGETLTADTSGIADADGLTSVSYSYQWIRNDGSSDSDIQNATGSSYTPVAADEGKTIKVRMSFTDDAGYGETLTSAATAAVDAAPNSPATGAPAITGAAQVGETLTADTSGIADADGLSNVSYSYQWIRNDGSSDSDITSATGSSYTLAADDEGRTIKVKVSFTDDADNGETLTSAATATVDAAPNSPATGAPSISGTAQVGETLTADTSGIADADGLTSVSYSYQWIRNDGSSDSDIQNATGSSYTLVAADEGKTIKVRMSFTDDAGYGETLTSAATAAVDAAPNSPATRAPTITGTAQVGQTLTADISAIADADGLANVSYSYQWVANDGTADTDITGATASTYTLAADDEGKTIKVRVSFTDDAGYGETLTSAATAAVDAAPNSPATRAPTITGTAQVGQTLTADISAIADADGLDTASYSYQWIANDGTSDTDIAGATDSTYTLVAADEGKTIKVRVSFTDDAGYGETLTSAATAAVDAAPNSPATGAPTVTGTAQVGETLSADTSAIADADGLANVSFSYQWIRNDGSSDTDITGATDSTHSLDDADEGKTIKVKVGFTDDADNDESLTSAATVSVTARPIPGSAPDTPDQPVGTAVFVGGVDLEWNDVPGADSYDVQLFRNGQWMDLPGDGVEIASYGAGAIISELDPGSTHWFQVRAGNAHGSSDWSDFRQVGSTNQSSLGKQARPDNVMASGAPVINGTAQVGESLTADTTGIEDGNGLDRVQFRFQWVSNDGSADADITGATDSTYTLVAADEGKTVKVRVSFTDRGGYAESLTSAATDSVSFAVQQQVANSPATGAPAITGTAQVGQTLTADTSAIADADGLSNVTYSYQWVANDGTNDTDISGATGSTYTLVDADEGKTVKVKVSFADDPGNDETLTSAATAAVDAASNSPATGAPAITGTAQVGETLTADTSGIADADGLSNVSYSYQWIRNDGSSDSDITSATGSSYTLATDDEGRTIKVKVSFTDDADNGETLTSAATAAVDAEPNSPATGTPTITGTAQVGQTLTADTYEIADADGLTNVSYSYQWIANDGTSDTAISGATNSTYTLVNADEGGTIKVRVSFTDDAGNDETLTSGATATVDAAPNSPATGAPSISGTAQVGETLTADTSGIADADGLTSVSYSYQWIRNDGSSDSDIQNATGSSYTLVAADEGKTIKVRMSFTDDAGHGETLTSAATGIVAAALLPLTVSLENNPATHNGTDVFTFEIRFSEEFPLSFRTLKFHALQVTGGTVKKALRVDNSSDIHWRITVRPDANGNVTIVLPVTNDCDDQGAICTRDGRKLSNGLEFTVAGPGG